MSVRLMERLVPEAFYAVAEELGLDDNLLMDAEVVFVEEAKADIARPHGAFEALGNGQDPKDFMRDWARGLMAKVLCRLETRPHDQFHALSA